MIQFGNSEIRGDGPIALAKSVTELTNDIGRMRAAIDRMVYQKGFTNKAQAYTLAENMFPRGGRCKGSQQTDMTLTDGKPPFLLQTEEMIMQLKDKHMKLFFGPSWDLMATSLRS